MQDYLEWKRSTTKHPMTPVYYERWVRRYLRFLKGKPISIESIGQFRAHLLDLGLSPKNIQYGSYLIRDYISYQMTVHGLKFPLSLLKIPQERSKSHHAITYEEYEKMRSVLSKNEAIELQRLLMITLLWETGMRVGELLDLKMSQLKPRETFIHNEKNHRNRLISWSRETEKLLQFYLPLRRHMKAEEDYLFVSFRWKPCRKLSSRQVERIVEEICKKANIKSEIRPHSFRHGFVHRKLDEGKAVTTVAQMLGHSSTMNVLTYAQLNGKEIREAWVM